jgi:hypothetical protein
MTGQEPAPGRLGNYRVLRRLGEGGMGIVYLAADPQDRVVAVKALRQGVSVDPHARRRLAREVETMRRVHSPFVAEVIDADVSCEPPYIVTRYVEGRTLEDVVAQSGPLAGPALARVAYGLASALTAVHAAGVVHRDLKPGNVMLADGRPVVIDFGIAQAPDLTRLTMTGMFMGTPGYLAPEVIEGKQSGPAADVHSWGATVAFAATGRPPFGIGSFESIFYRIVHGQPDLDRFPAVLTPLVAHALARDPARRPSAADLCTRLAAMDPESMVPGAAPGAAPGQVPAGTQGTIMDYSPGAAAPAQAPAPAAGSQAAGLAVAAGLAAAVPNRLQPPDAGPATASPVGLPPGAAGSADPFPAGWPAPAGSAAPGAADPAAPGSPAPPSAAPGSAAPGSAAAPSAALPSPVGVPPPGAAAANGQVPPDAAVPNGRYPAGQAAPAGSPAWSRVTRPLAVRSGRRQAKPDYGDVLPPVQYDWPGSAAPGWAAPPGAGDWPAGAAAPPGGVSPAGAGPASAGAAPARKAGHTGPLLAAAAVAVGVCAAVLLPVAGTLAALAGLLALRAASITGSSLARRRSGRGSRATDPVIAAVVFPVGVLRSVLRMVLLAPLAAVVGGIVAAITIVAVPADPLPQAGAYAAGAIVAFYGLGPGSSGCRRPLVRFFNGLGSTQVSAVIVVLGMAAVAIGAIVAAATHPPFYWPFGNLSVRLQRLPTVHGLIHDARVAVLRLVGR